MLYQILARLDELFHGSIGLGLAVSFIAGFLAGLSPCIYPMIPITLGVVGAVAVSTKLRPVIVSLVFVLGVATLYSAAGVIAALAGRLFSSYIVNPVTYFALFLIFFALGLSECGVFKLSLPFFSVSYPSQTSRNLFSVFILGLISGFAVIPCNFPVLFSILNIIAAKRNIIYGATALFIFSLGYGAPLIFLGIFASLIRSLPKRPFWLIIVKKIIGGVLIAVSMYFLYKWIMLMRP